MRPSARRTRLNGVDKPGTFTSDRKVQVAPASWDAYTLPLRLIVTRLAGATRTVDGWIDDPLPTVDTAAHVRPPSVERTANTPLPPWSLVFCVPLSSST